ncbi:MAG TPA: citrate/2-methylcitrate synthase [Actinomycetota bacterium]|jgi:citrate synthase|nr:citrate/2-methylcitrate synthase [Actinomycetota bacterium]
MRGVALDAEVPRGLDGVPVAKTQVSDVDGLAGFYHYRGIDPTTFARTGTFEDAWHLLLTGNLPSEAERAAFTARLRAAMHLPPVLREALPSLAALGPPGSMDVLRTGVSAAGVAIGCRPWTEQDRATTDEQVLKIAALTPVLAAALYRLGRGEEPIPPSPDLSLAANYLLMIHGNVPDPVRASALDTYLVLAADHGFCNSTFAERVIVSSGADVGAALSGAVGSLSGPLHGGAIDRVPTMLAAIGDASRVESWLRDRLDRGERLMGFGHAVYQAPDPRTTVLRAVAKEVDGERAALAEIVERTGVRLLNERKSDKHREANIELYAGMVVEFSGVPEELFGCTFAIARMAGWTASLLEQIADNRIFRPAALYVGRPPS